MQRFKQTLSQGVDDDVKTIYSPPPSLIERQFLESFIVKSPHIVTANRPMNGLVAFVRALQTMAAMKSPGGCPSALHPSLPASYQWLDRNEDQLHPGEGSA
ncbi:hypothetical protein [Piscinibacter sp.]|uniref:hypothetical protein n=1 Tax=Piscinibacter sp. TaxID=1903157 RepID=UPI002CA0C192|nr:hypothetical protein [Albitalea sp.]HUG25335.1 hypothetical protein [Albitalea sp.]